MSTTQAPRPALGTHMWPVRVYYEDTDAGSVVYYANYLRFMERARTEMLREAGVDQRALLKATNIAFVVRHADVDYRASARLDDALMVRTRVLELRPASVIFSQDVLRDATVCVAARIKIACVDLAAGKVTPFPPDIASLMTPAPDQYATAQP